MTPIRFSLVALVAGAALVTLSCSDRHPVGLSRGGPSADVDAPASSLPSSLVWCSPLPYDSVAQQFGPAGGTLRVGPHTLTIPPGALADTVTITAVAPSDTVNAVRFGPAGLTFADHADLTMSYANCAAAVALPKRIALTTDDLLGILEYLKSVDHRPLQAVTGRVEHFSAYAVAW